MQYVAGNTVEPDNWQDVLRRAGHVSRNTLIRYRDGAQIIANADMSHPDLAACNRWEQLKAMLQSYGLPEDLIGVAMFTIGRYTLGFVFEDQADPHSGSPMRADFDAQFERGLDLIIAGIAVQFEDSFKQ